MASKINEKLGLNPKTRTRQATHGRLVAGSVRCPACGSRHCLRTESWNGKLAGSHWCARCSAFFFATEASTR